jgi:hypothetical protein
VLSVVAAHLSRLRRGDLVARSHQQLELAGLDGAGKKRARADELARRKRDMTGASSSRWAGTILRGNEDQYRLARMAQQRHILSLRASIAALTVRIAAPTHDCLTPQQRRDLDNRVKSTHSRAGKGRKGRRPVRGYATQQERFQKQRRVQILTATLARVSTDQAAGVVHVVDGGRRLAQTRLNLAEAGISAEQWRQRWDTARDVISANGSSDEPLGNLTLTVTPAGDVSLRLPAPLDHLANAPRGRYRLTGAAVFAHRGQDWAERITSTTGPKAVSYTLTRRPGRDGWYLTASWATPPTPILTTTATDPDTDVLADVLAQQAVVGVDLNADHLALRRLDRHGNPLGSPARIELAITGTSTRRDAQVRHAITQLIHYTTGHQITAIAIENLNFDDARTIGRETMGRGARGKTFRRTVAGIPTAVFRTRLTGMLTEHGIALFAVNPAYTSQWGDQHWRKPYPTITRHEAAATVIGRRAQGHRARRRAGVTCARPEDRTTRATAQATPRTNRPAATATGQGHGAPKPAHPTGTESGHRTRATVTPGPLTNNGQRD